MVSPAMTVTLVSALLLGYGIVVFGGITQSPQAGRVLFYSIASGATLGFIGIVPCLVILRVWEVDVIWWRVPISFVVISFIFTGLVSILFRDRHKEK